MGVWKSDLPTFEARTDAERYLKSYLIQLNNQLEWALQNIGTENLNRDVTKQLTAAVAGAASGAKVVEMSAADKRRIEELRQKITDTAAELTKEIQDTAQEISSTFESAIVQTRQEISTEVSEGYIARSEDVEAGTSSELVELLDSHISQTSTAWQATFDQLTQVVDGNEREFNEYVELTETYIRLTAAGIEIGMKEQGQSAPYSVLLNNEKLSFRQYGAEVAYIQYNKLYVTAGEFLDRFSVGSAANGGFFEFVTTQQGLGIKWRGV